jgi:hypothetical protein
MISRCRLLVHQPERLGLDGLCIPLPGHPAFLTLSLSFSAIIPYISGEWPRWTGRASSVAPGILLSGFLVLATLWIWIQLPTHPGYRLTWILDIGPKRLCSPVQPRRCLF